MTRNLKFFVLFSLLWSVPFYAILHWMLYDQSKRGIIMPFTSLLYGIGFSVAGYQLGRRDSQRNVRYNLGIRYSMASIGSSLIVAAGWIFIWRDNYWWLPASYLLISLVIFGVYASVNRNGIKGIPKERIFK